MDIARRKLRDTVHARLHLMSLYIKATPSRSSRTTHTTNAHSTLTINTLKTRSQHARITLTKHGKAHAAQVYSLALRPPAPLFRATQAHLAIRGLSSSLNRLFSPSPFSSLPSTYHSRQHLHSPTSPSPSIKMYRYTKDVLRSVCISAWFGTAVLVETGSVSEPFELLKGAREVHEVSSNMRTETPNEADNGLRP